ncbi:helix-turn-helix domain-containing protein [Desulfocurvus sp. DL9XJH121]
MKPHADIRFWRGADLPGLEVAMIRNSDHAFPKHTHEHYAVGIMEKGACWCVDVGAAAPSVAKGQVMLIGPGQVHSGVPTSSQRVTYRMLYVDPEWMRRAAGDLADRPVGYPEFAAWVATDPAVYGQLRRVTEAAAGGGELLLRQSAMVTAFSRLLASWGRVRDAVPPRPEHRAVALVKDYLAAHLQDKVCLEDLAREAGLSRYYLLRVFKRETGMSPHAFHLQMRVERAKLLLLSSRAIAQAALDTGFTDQSHFTNVFRRFTGATPGQYLSL